MVLRLNIGSIPVLRSLEVSGVVVLCVCKVICGAPTTLAVKGLMIMMMMMMMEVSGNCHRLCLFLYLSIFIFFM